MPRGPVYSQENFQESRRNHEHQRATSLLRSDCARRTGHGCASARPGPGPPLRVGEGFGPEHHAADLDAPDARVPIQGADEGLTRELLGRDLGAERGGIDVDRMPARRLDDRYAGRD